MLAKENEWLCYKMDWLYFKNIKWPGKTMLMQKNWIGKSTGAIVNFKIENKDMELLDKFEQEFITSWNPTIEP